MGDRINPGVGEAGPLARRMAAMERFFSCMTKTRIIANDEFGTPKKFTVVSSVGTPAVDASAAIGAFFGVYKGKEQKGWCLQGGQVSAGDKEEVLDYVFLVKTGSEPDDGYKHWLQITGDGVAANGRLYAGFTKTKVTPGHGEAMPQSTLPTKTTPKGRDCYVLLGMWQSKRFVPSQTGNIAVTFCPSQGYTVHRGS